MKNTMLLILVLMLSGCARAQLMRCPAPAAPGHFVCPEKVEGLYRLCTTPKEVYQCSEAN